MRAVAYVRVSSEEQVQGTSLDSQFKECLRYAEHEGIELREEDVFREEGVSAKIIDRPELAHMLDFCAKNKGKIHQCIVWKVDRLARNASYHQIIKSKLASYGIKLVSVTEPIDDDPTGTLMENILAAFAQFDNDIRTARTTAGMRARTEQGGWPHSAPFGYRKARMPSGIVSLAPDPEKAPLVKALLETFATGNYTIEGCLAVAYKLGIRDKHDKPRGWQSMKNLLINPLYAGIVQSKFTDGRKIQGLHEAIISERTHYQIVNIVDGNTHNFTRYAEAGWPLRGGFMKHTCGNILTGSAPRGRNGPSPRYHCTYCKASSGKSVSKRREIVHDQFLDLLRSIRLDGDIQALFKEIVLTRWNNEYKDLLEHNKRVQHELQIRIRY